MRAWDFIDALVSFADCADDFGLVKIADQADQEMRRLHDKYYPQCSDRLNGLLVNPNLSQCPGYKDSEAILEEYQKELSKKLEYEDWLLYPGFMEEFSRRCTCDVFKEFVQKAYNDLVK